ncbi:MAG: DUF3574 domain-containing protein [Dokdonella sp.]|uniref:DUF3574 domain-containing protein n=1 Tax=Dokdonella sp. TaxID=2291710 RepID=UPI003264B950
MTAAGCAGHVTARPEPPTLVGEASHPTEATGWVRTELYFGTGLADDPRSGVSDADWRSFMDSEVTVRFPDGLSVFDIYGQWRGTGQTVPARLRSKVIVLLYADTPAHRADIEAIRSAWKKRTGDQSVLRVTQPADVSF